MWLFVLLAAVVVFVVAAVTVGREAWRLGHQPRSTIFDVDEAVAYVADNLPIEAQARLTYDEVRILVSAQLDHLHRHGIIGLPGEDPELVRPRTDGEEEDEGDERDVVVADDDTVAVVLGAAEDEGMDVADHDVFLVVTALNRYLDEIGAVGPSAS